MMKTVRNTVGNNIEDQIQCPFVPSHFLRKDRFAIHVGKCRKHLDKTSPYYEKAMNMVQCRFNCIHYVKKEDLDKHHQVCEDKSIAENYMENLPPPHWAEIMCKVTNVPNVDDEEDWDAQPQVESYDPMKKVKENPDILFIPQGMSKSQLRQFRQRRRLQKNQGDDYDGFSDDDENFVEARPYPVAQQPRQEANPAPKKSQNKKPNSKAQAKSQNSDWNDPEDFANECPSASSMSGGARPKQKSHVGNEDIAPFAANHTKTSDWDDENRWSAKPKPVSNWDDENRSSAKPKPVSNWDDDDWTPPSSSFDQRTQTRAAVIESEPKKRMPKSATETTTEYRPLRRPQPADDPEMPVLFLGRGRGSNLSDNRSTASGASSIPGLGRGSEPRISIPVSEIPITQVGIGRGLGRGIGLNNPPPGFGLLNQVASPYAANELPGMTWGLQSMSLNPSYASTGLGRGRGQL